MPSPHLTRIDEPSPDPGSFVELPTGEFQMGGSPDDKFVTAIELPRRTEVITDSFFLGRSPVTEREWALFTGEPSADVDGGMPVVNVSWNQVHDYLGWLSNRYQMNCRLPSEPEWEFACRGGQEGLFPSGSFSISTADANYLYDERGNVIGIGGRTPVGSYPCNGFGLFDMVGNVSEWTASAWTSQLDGTAGSNRPDAKTIRGGAWDHLPRLLRNSWRDWALADARHDNLGFRVAIDFEK